MAALLNVAPPVVGSYALGRETYGMVASVLATTMMVFGPLSQYLSQKLLRALCTAEQTERPVGAAILFCIGCAGLIEFGYLAGWITTSHALQLCILLVAQLLLRVCEVKLISEEKVASSILVFYAAPPLCCSVLYVVAAFLGGGPVAAAAAQSFAYGVAALFAMHTAKGVAGLLVRGLCAPAVSAVREFAASLPLMISGGATTATEYLPTVLLGGLNAYAVIPVFEIAKKIASVPTTLVNPLLNQVNPGMIRAYAANDRPAIHGLLRRMFRFLVYTGIFYACCVVATLIAGVFELRVREISGLLIPLSIGSIAAMWCVPYQSLLIAARGDHWFAISSGVGVVLLLGLTYLFSALGPGLAVACAVGLSVAASGLIVRYRAIKET